MDKLREALWPVESRMNVGNKYLVAMAAVLVLFCVGMSFGVVLAEAKP